MSRKRTRIHTKLLELTSQEWLAPDVMDQSRETYTVPEGGGGGGGEKEIISFTLRRHLLITQEMIFRLHEQMDQMEILFTPTKTMNIRVEFGKTMDPVRLKFIEECKDLPPKKETTPDLEHLVPKIEMKRYLEVISEIVKCFKWVSHPKCVLSSPATKVVHIETELSYIWFTEINEFFKRIGKDQLKSFRFYVNLQGVMTLRVILR